MATTKAYELAQLGNDLTVDSAGNLIFDTTIDVDYNGFDSDFGLKSTSNLTEGSNLYFTDARVETAGALMDTEVTNLAEVKAFAASDYATAAQGSTADAALPKAGGAMTGAITTNSTFDGRDGGAPSTLNDLNELAAAINDDANYNTTLTTALATKLPLAGGAMTGAITTNSTFDGRDVATDGTKLDTIETNAKDDQTITAGTGLTGGGTGNVTVTLNPAISATSLTLTGGVTAAPASSLVVYNSGGTAVKTVHGITST